MPTTRIVCAVLIGGLVANAKAADAAVVSFAGNGHRYELVLDEGVTWDDASAAAAARGAGWHLATITDATENAFIRSLFSAGPPTFVDSCLSSSLVGLVCGGLWIGGVSSGTGSNDWTWVTGEAFTFSDWGPFEPFRNGDRIRIDEFRSLGTIAWNDVPSGRTLTTGYILENSSTTSPIPLPASLFFLVAGITGLAVTRRRKPPC